MKTRDIMSVEKVAVRQDDFVTKARQLLRDNLLHSMPVVDGEGRAVGMITSQDALRVTSSKSNVTVSGYIQPCPAVTPDTPIVDAAKALVAASVGHIPVMDDAGRLVGTVSMKQVFRALDFTRMNHIPVSRVMTQKVETSTPDEDVSTLWMRMIESGYTGYPVVEKGRVVGMVTRKDLLNAGTARIGREGHKVKAGTSVTKMMSTSVIAVSEDDNIHLVVDVFRREGIGRVPVLRNGKLAGIVDRHDIVHAYLGGMN